MTLKNYQRVKIALTIILALVISQSLVFKNYLIPIALMVASALVLIFLRRRVSEVIADERDYMVGGKAALLTIQIYGWVATIAMLIFYGLRDYNSAYQPIGLVLAFSTCILLLLYSLFFRYYHRVSLADKKYLYTALVLLLFLVFMAFALRVFSGEDNWLCQNGEWVKHGQPDYPAPNVECK
ncbi:MAG TPA: DUF2178 domain-containing protein [bacterium]|nr:DUF2178 domain-containing protein [bacterium]